MKRLAQQRRKAIDLMKRGGRVLKASMKLVVFTMRLAA
jgi:hypothetical protein